MQEDKEIWPLVLLHQASHRVWSSEAPWRNVGHMQSEKYFLEHISAGTNYVDSKYLQKERDKEKNDNRHTLPTFKALINDISVPSWFKK